MASTSQASNDNRSIAVLKEALTRAGLDTNGDRDELVARLVKLGSKPKASSTSNKPVKRSSKHDMIDKVSFLQKYRPYVEQTVKLESERRKKLETMYTDYTNNGVLPQCDYPGDNDAAYYVLDNDRLQSIKGLRKIGQKDGNSVYKKTKAYHTMPSKREREKPQSSKTSKVARKTVPYNPHKHDFIRFLKSSEIEESTLKIIAGDLGCSVSGDRNVLIRNITVKFEGMRRDSEEKNDKKTRPASDRNQKGNDFSSDDEDIDNDSDNESDDNNSDDSDNEDEDNNSDDNSDDDNSDDDNSDDNSDDDNSDDNSKSDDNSNNNSSDDSDNDSDEFNESGNDSD